MELVVETLNTKQFVPTELCQRTFKQAGGVIGRGEDCDWIIPDRKRHLSNHHAIVSYREGSFFLTDTSSNGVQDGSSGARLHKGEPVRIEHGSTYILGDFEIRARLVRDPATFDGEVGRPRAAGSIIPDDAFLDLDPLNALEQQERVYSEIDELLAPTAKPEDSRQRADYARIDMESLMVPELITAPVEPEPAPAPKAVERQSEGFWEHFGAALGVDVKGLSHDEREALALNAARLLRQSVLDYSVAIKPGYLAIPLGQLTLERWVPGLLGIGEPDGASVSTAFEAPDSGRSDWYGDNSRDALVDVLQQMAGGR